LPAELYPDRRNSDGLDLSDEDILAMLSNELEAGARHHWMVGDGTLSPRVVLNPADSRDKVGSVADCPVARIPPIVERAAHCGWGNVPVEERAGCLERAADAFQSHMPALAGLIVREAGRTLPNALSEVREAIDFLRYYAAQARLVLGKDNRPIGPIACISPWNFPLAIFTGQVAAALARGNPVLAKPAEETPLIAAEAVRLLHEAGVSAEALQLVPGDGMVGAKLVEQAAIAGVVFTGSTGVARKIQQAIAGRVTGSGAPVVLVAETGGQNAMIVDSSALPEQVVADVIASAFDSAGQRCSALRVLCLQEDIANRTLAMLEGAMRELHVGRPDRLAIDIGPVINAEARDGIERHVAAMQAAGKRVTRLRLGDDTRHGTFVAPTLIEIDAMSELTHEVFGPVLHILRFRRERLGELIEAVNATGYGLTFGVHSRLDGTIADLAARAEAGNVYVNRNMVGAVVGVQPFGGRALSGTGPKAGGPLYLPRLVRPVPSPGLPVGQPDARLSELVAWLEARGESSLATTARAYGETTPFNYEVELAGPVGETNRYRLDPRGAILLMPQTRDGLIEQMAAVLASGNRGTMAGMALPCDLPHALADSFRETGPISAALIEGDAAQVIAAAQMLAERPGAIVPLHVVDREAPLSYPAQYLLEEKTVCINTTAAGGNASLMAMN
jgi:RHH-type proline utilization regulon transcriptional repressor/proline dehydrogenase/delta 1-pyrroline-5-carboxylate dehydrogenase